MTALRRDGARRWAGLLAAGSVLAGLLTAAAPGAASAAAAAPCVSMTGTQPPNPGSGDNALAGVAVRSPCDAWAVGFSGGVTNNNGQLRTFIVHWDGARWTQVPSQDPGGAENFLNAVAATSATNAWAVGSSADSGSFQRTLIEHWDGSHWTQIASPNSGVNSVLTAVAATSATNAWAVGFFDPPEGGNQTLIEHWDGTSWTQVPSPSAGELLGVLGIGWAVGRLGNGTLIEHWDGRTWSVVPGADLRSGAVGSLAAVSAASPTNIWAVGALQASEDDPRQMLIEHYDGTRWTQSARPGPGSLQGVSVTGASDAWAVGEGTGNSAAIVHYDGTNWVPVPTNTSFSLNLEAVSASSPASVWAVGLGPVGSSRALHLRCC